MAPPAVQYTVQSLILYGKNILQELLSRELMTVRHVLVINSFDNHDVRLSSKLTLEIQSNLCISQMNHQSSQVSCISM